MPFTPELFNIEPCCLSDKNNNKEYAVEFTIPTEQKAFQEMFGMEYTEGIESVILFHEKLHADLPTQEEEKFANPMQREIDCHLKHSIIELLANGEMGINMANHSNYFQSTFHMGKIPYKNRELTTEDLPKLGMKDNELLHTEAKEFFGEKEEDFSKEQMGIIKIRAMMYPYVLMYKNRNKNNQIETVLEEIKRDLVMIEKIYGKEFIDQIHDISFLEQVQKSIEPYNNLLSFAEGMSKELLGIEQIKISNKEEQDNNNSSNIMSQILFSENEIGKATCNRERNYQALKIMKSEQNEITTLR